MKKTIFRGLTLALILAATTISLSAQPNQRCPMILENEATAERPEKRTPPTPEEFATKISEKMAEKYSLTTAQTKKVYQLNLKLAEAKQEAIELEKNLTKNTLAILDDDQKIEYMESMAKMRGRKMAKERAPQCLNMRDQRGHRRATMGAMPPQQNAKRAQPKRAPKRMAETEVEAPIE